MGVEAARCAVGSTEGRRTRTIARIMDIEETRLPGVGLKHDLITRLGQRVGVVSQRTGDREIVLYDRDDPDACRAVVHLNPQESEALAELLGAPRVIERLARLREQIEGIATEGIVLADGTPYVGRTLADAQVRTRTGASVVAVVRQGEVTPQPAPDFRFQAGDKVIAVGTDEGVRAVAALLALG